MGRDRAPIDEQGDDSTSEDVTKPEPWRSWRARHGTVLAWLSSPEWALRWIACSLQGLAVIKLLGLAGNVVIVASLLTFLLEADKRKEGRITSAWNLIMTAEGKPGDGGRTYAIRQLIEDGADLAYLPLHNASIGDWDLRGLNVTGSDFRNASIEGLNARRCSAARTKFMGASIEISDFDQADLRGADFDGAVVSDSSFAGSNLRRASFEQVVFLNTRPRIFEGADLEGASFRDARFVTERLADWPTDRQIRAMAAIPVLRDPPYLSGARLCRTIMPDGSRSDRDCAG